MDLMSEDGVDTDVIPDGVGEFGLVSSNPIPLRPRMVLRFFKSNGILCLNDIYERV